MPADQAQIGDQLGQEPTAWSRVLMFDLRSLVCIRGELMPSPQEKAAVEKPDVEKRVVE